MPKHQSKGFFDRTVTIHRHDCLAMTPPKLTPEDANLPRVEEISNDFQSGQFGKYAVDARPSYEGMRRLVGQLAGFIILLRVSGRRELLELPELEAARRRWSELHQLIAALSPPAALASHKALLVRSHELTAMVLGNIDEISSPEKYDAALNHAGEQIKLAYKLLQSASDERAGFNMVDFSQACCSCSPVN